MTTILIIDDSPNQVELVAGILATDGYRVVSAHSGEDGLARLREQRIDLVISDILMPGIDGYEVCRRIKASNPIPVILLTRLQHPLDILNGLECGADHFVTKPFSTGDFLRQIAALIEHWPQRDTQRIRVRVEAKALGHHFTLSSGRNQILNLLLRTCERCATAEHQPEDRLALDALTERVGASVQDFNNLVSVIGSHSDALVYKIRPGDPPHEEVRISFETETRGARLSLNLPRRSLRDDPPSVPVEVNVVIRDLDQRFRTLLGSAIELNSTHLSEQSQVSIARPELEQALINLLMHARGSITGSGKICIETGRIDLDATHAAMHGGSLTGLHTQIIITDTGCGMSAKDRACLTGTRSADDVAWTDSELRLAAVAAIMRKHKGQVVVYSEPGQGTTVNLYAPVPLDEPTPSAANHTDSKRQQDPPPVPYSILIIEDDEQIGRLVHEVLNVAGYQVTRVRTPSQAIEHIAQMKHPLHLVITDLVLPEMNGTELIKLIATLVPGVKSLLISGYGEWATVHHQLVEPGTPFLQKPFTLKALSTKVGELIGAG